MGNAAETFDELIPMVDLCKAEKLFEVQAWIDAGNPVNPPDGHFRGSRKKSPLYYAIDSGFHSLVKVLLDGGTMFGPIDGYFPMRMALEKRRIDDKKVVGKYRRKINEYLDLLEVHDATT